MLAGIEGASADGCWNLVVKSYLRLSGLLTGIECASADGRWNLVVRSYWRLRVKERVSGELRVQMGVVTNLGLGEFGAGD